jgi:gamma-glutamylaminecyclotransferase
MSESIYLFVYGTLKRGERNHPLLSGQPYIQPARTRPTYRLYNCGPYPALVHDSAGLAVEGEVYLVASSAFGQIDLLEDAPRLYRLEPVALADFDRPVFTYVYQQDVSGLTDCGPSWTGQTT